jgi:hypothetical protein
VGVVLDEPRHHRQFRGIDHARSHQVGRRVRYHALDAVAEDDDVDVGADLVAHPVDQAPSVHDDASGGDGGRITGT